LKSRFEHGGLSEAADPQAQAWASKVKFQDHPRASEVEVQQGGENPRNHVTPNSPDIKHARNSQSTGGRRTAVVLRGEQVVVEGRAQYNRIPQKLATYPETKMAVATGIHESGSKE
jgi:hypothetical protein